MKITRWLCGTMLAGIVFGGVGAAAAAEDQQAQRNEAMKLFQQGNFKEAYDASRKLALDPKHVLPPPGEELSTGRQPRRPRRPLPPPGEELSLAVQCLQRLNRLGEADALLEAVVEVHRENWRKLAAVAQQYMNVPHQGFIVAGKFERGPRRGAQGGQMVNSWERDRIRALQLMVQALPKARQDDNHGEVGRYLLSLGEILLNNRGWSEAWRLQYKSDLAVLPDYDPGWGYYHETSGAPVDEQGNPVYHYTPKSFEEAKSDGERWRWCLEQAMEFDPGSKNAVRSQFADFLHNQFGVQTMAYFGWRFGQMQTDDTQKDESGTYALHTLKENETIARLATGIKRFELPDEFNFIKIYQQIADDPKTGHGDTSLEQLAQIFENRRQYPQAADYWKRLLKEYPGDDNRRRNWQDRLDQIVGNWGRFEQITTQPAGKGATVEYRFRNGTSVDFNAQQINVKKLLDDVKAYLKSNPGQLDWNKVNIGNIGYRLVWENQKEYLGEEVAKWQMKVDPRPDHFDKRVTVTTPLQKPGAYLLTAKMANGNTCYVIIWVADTAIVKKPLDGKTYYFVADAVSGKPIAKANLEFFGFRQEQRGNQPNSFVVLTKQFAAFTDADGQVIHGPQEQPPEYQWIIIATTEDGRFAYLGFTGAWYGQRYDAEYNEVKAFAITDRPVYRPKQTVHYKFWVGQAQYDQEDVSQFAGKKIALEIYNPKGERVVQEEVEADAYGGIEGKLELPADTPLGVYQMNVGELGGVAPEPPQPPQPGPMPGVRRPGRAAPIVEGGPLGIRQPNVGKRQMTQHYGGGSFRVEEYKKPEFEVTVEAPKEPVMLGEKITATINAKYYFGGPVTQAKVKYKVMRTSIVKRWYPFGPWDWLYGSGYWWFAYDYPWYPGWNSWGCMRPMPFWWPMPQPQPELVADREVEIGPDGIVKVEIDTGVAKAIHPDQDHRYAITAEVVDQSRRTIVGTGEVLVARQPFKVYAWVDRGYYRVGDTIQSHYSARTLDDKPVEGKGTVTLLRISYKDGKPVETAVGSRDLDTNVEGMAAIQLKASQAGQYRLSYKLTDAKQHAIEGGYLLTIIGEGFDGSQFRFNNIELIPDKREYAPGESVKLQINTDRVGSTVLLFTRPTNGVYLQPKVIRLQGKSTVEEIGVVKKDMPNFFVEAVTIADGKVHTEMKEIVVPPEKRVLNVELKPSSAAYKPGEKARVQIKLTDFTGEAFVGSTVVAIYDKSVEYISGGSNVPEIKEFFWKWRRHHHPQTEENLSQRFDNLLAKGAKDMNFIGVFGGTVAEEMDELMQQLEQRVTTYSGRGFGMGGGGMGAPGAVMRRGMAEMANGMALEVAGVPMAAAPMEAEGRSMDKAAAGPAGGEAPALVQPTVRKEFADTALWVGALETKKDGTAEVELNMPENLTTWRIKVWGMGHGTKVGEGATDVVTRKDLIVRLQAPRFFVQTDEVVLSANVHNYLKGKKSVQVALELEGKTLEALEAGKLTQTAQIEPNGEARIDWRVKVLDEGQAVVRMKALTDEESDAMEMTFPCYIHGMLKMDSYSGAIRPKDSSGRFTVKVPAERRPAQSRLEVRYSPTLAGAMVDALPYMVDYPYGCTEQTLNRFLPTVVTQKILLQMGLDLKDIEKKRTNLNAQEIGEDTQRAKGWQRFDRNPVFDEEEVRRMVKEGVQRLTEMQLSDGGWGWFSGWGEHSSPHTTALVVHGLQIAQQNDVALVPGMLQRGVDWLKRYQDEQVQRLNNALATPKKEPWKDQADDVDAFVYMVLADADVKHPQMLDFLYRDRTKLAVYGMAMYGMALHKQGEQEKLAMIVRNIGQYLQQDDENQTAWLNLPGGYWWYWYGSEYEAHAYYLKLLSKTDPKGEIAPRLVKYLLNNRKHSTYWNSTRDTSLCIEAMADFIRASGEDKPEMTVEIWYDGKQQKAVEITGKNLFVFDNKFVLEGQQVAAGQHEVELRKKGTGPLYYNGYLTNFTLEDFITKAGLEVKVERKYYRLKKVEKTVKAAGSRGQVVDQQVEKYEREELPNLSTLKSGELCEIELVIESKNDYEYLVFEDMKPAGFEPVDLRSGYNGNTLGAYVEFRDNRVVLFARTLARGKHSVAYRMRAEIPGKFSALPTRAWAMYAPELKGNSDEIKLKVED